jgi:DNA polymerase I-like protein with 3'-5' exonuclease and polymerase domains
MRRARPKIVLLLGRTAAQTLLKSKRAVAKMRGKGWYQLRLSDELTVDAYVTYHPSILHHDPDKKSIIESDLLRVKRRLMGEDSGNLVCDFTYLDDLGKLDEAIDETLQQEVVIGFDWEALDLRLVNVQPLCWAWGWRVKQKGKKVYKVFGVPLQHPNTPFSPMEYPLVKKKLRMFARELRRLAEEGAIELTAHNGKFDNSLCADVFHVTFPRLFCTLQGAHAIDENRLKGGTGGEGIFSLEALSSDWLGLDPDFWDDNTSELLYSGQGDKTNIKKLTDHCGRDVAAQIAVRYEIQRRAKAQDYDFSKIMPLLEATPYLLSHIERNGMPVDMNMLASLRSDKGPLVVRQADIMQELHTCPSVQKSIRLLRGGGDSAPLFAAKGGSRKGFSIRKRDYLATLFFDVLGLPWGAIKEQQTKTGLAKIDKDFFEEYKGNQEVSLVAEWKALDKLVSTYIESWWELVKASPDGRIRANFNPAGTTTGRLSCKNPNLQQIPKGKSEAAKILKKVFKPNCIPGSKDLRVIVSCDLSQAEVRWLAEISGEDVLRDMYVQRAEMLDLYSRKPSPELAKKIKDECDLHRSTAAEMEGIPISGVTDEQRGAAKAITFGNIYGQTGHGLAAQIGCSEEEADKKLARWMGRFIRARDWFEATEAQAKKYGWVESPLGRRRHLDALLLGAEIREGSAMGHLLRVSRNAPIQSVASDMNLWLAIKVQKYIEKHEKPWLLLALVHDAIIAEIPIDDALEYVSVVRKMGESPSLLKPFGVNKLWVPHELEFEVGFSYGEVIKLTTSVKEQEQVVEKLWKTWMKAA